MYKDFPIAFTVLWSFLFCLIIASTNNWNNMPAYKPWSQL